MSTSSTPLVFITGASSGLGQALALHYYAQGWRLALVARRPALLQDWVRGQGWDVQRCAVYGADVADVDSIVGAGQACLEAQGVPEVVVACAGFSTGVDTRYREDLAVMARTFATNNVGTAATFHPFIAPMQARGRGTLVGVASVHGIRGMPGHGAYCPSKAAVISYCEALRGELRSQGVRVVTLVPGYVDTPLTRHNSYSMPFLMPAHRFAQVAARAIAAGRSYQVIPWQMGVVAKFLRLLPNAAFDRLFASRPRKPRAAPPS